MNATTAGPLPRIVRHAEFFAIVGIPPALRPRADGTYALDFVAWRNGSWWGAALFIALMAFAIWGFAHFLGWWLSALLVVLSLVPPSLYYYCSARRVARERAVQVRGRALWLGRPELALAGDILGVRYIELRAGEDPENPGDNWSFRVYVQIAPEHGEECWLPLLESINPLKSIARELAAAVDLPLEESRGWARLPEAGRAEAPPLVIALSPSRWLSKTVWALASALWIIAALAWHPVLPAARISCIVLASAVWLGAGARALHTRRCLVSDGGLHFQGRLGRWQSSEGIIAARDVRSLQFRVKRGRRSSTFTLVLIPSDCSQVRLFRSRDEAEARQLAAAISQRWGRLFQDVQYW